ncbi:MAG: hypothetical protein ACOCZJ_02875 [Thermoplasmatota archaeon]
MKTNQSLFKRTLTIGIIVMLSFFVLTTSFVTMTAESKADAPKWNNGDDWYYKLDRPEGDMTLKEEIKSENAEYVIDEDTYSCYMMERIWNMPNRTSLIKKFYRKDDLAEVGSVDQEDIRTYFGEPLKRFEFPLEVGDSWGGDTLQYKAQPEEEGEPESEVNYTYEVIDKTEIRVEAGNFEAYVLNSSIKNEDPSEPGQNQERGYAHLYYSPKVKNNVKIINYYGGEEIGSQELYSYNVTETNNNNSPSVGTLTAGVTAISMVALYNIIKKKRKK